MTKKLSALFALLLLGSLLTSCASNSDVKGALVVYSGRSEEFISPFFAEFTEKTGIEVDIRYGDSAALAAQILEEGENTPADLFLSQDAGALGASGAGLLSKLDEATLEKVSSEFRAQNGDWIGVTGRVRVLAYAPDRVKELPKSVDDLTKPEWKNRIALAPTNASFQAFVTAMIQSRGEATTEAWLNAINANSPKYYEKNSQIVEAIDAGKVDAGLVNHYYVWEVSEELGRQVNAKIAFFNSGDLGNLVNVSGVGIFKTSKRSEAAKTLIEYLLGAETQKKFVSETHEYSVVDPSLKPEGLIALNQVGAPAIDLANLSDLQLTQKLLIKVGML